MIAPNTTIKLLKCPLHLNETHQLTFSNATAQYNYFNGLANTSGEHGEEYTYQRENGVIRYAGTYDDLIQYNYVMYQNKNYGNKWFYAFITGMEYVNDNLTNIKISTDVFQTWQFEIQYKDVFIEREHVMNDTIGAHTLPEGLEVGEYIDNSSVTLRSDDYDQEGGVGGAKIVFEVSELIGGLAIYYAGSGHRQQGIFSGLWRFGVGSTESAIKIINMYDYAGKGEAIVSIFMLPVGFSQGTLREENVPISGKSGSETKTDTVPVMYFFGNSDTALTLNSGTAVPRPGGCDGYVPHNNKLFTYPYSYQYVDNNSGGNTIYRYEDFKNNSPEYMIVGAMTQGGDTKLLPINYKNSAQGDIDVENYEYGLTGGKFPICAWVTDSYLNWLTQNAVNYDNTYKKAFNTMMSGDLAAVGIFAGALSAAMTAGATIPLSAGLTAAGAALGGTMSGISMMRDAEAAKTQASFVPDQAKGNATNSALNWAMLKEFTVKSMSVRNEVARVIDKFFDLHGYQVNTVKHPYVTGRRNWNYVKTINCYLGGDIPQQDLKHLCEMFDRGITFWHNPATFMDYSQNNAIV